MGKPKNKRVSFAQMFEQVQQASIVKQQQLAVIDLSYMGGLRPEGESMLQLETLAKLDGMKRVLAFPDLHPGKGIPIGSVALSQGVFHPHVAGSDLGCGVSLFKVKVAEKELHWGKLSKRNWLMEQRFRDWLQPVLDRHPSAVGRWGGFESVFETLGGGNHFAEWGVVERALPDSPLLEGDVTLLIHTGSRMLGDRIAYAWSEHGLRVGNLQEAAGRTWWEDQAYALDWAAANRQAIAANLAQTLNVEIELVADVWHNGIEQVRLSELDQAALDCGGGGGFLVCA